MGLHGTPGNSYKTSWNILHKPREGMIWPGQRDALSGSVEAGGTYIGGLAEGSPSRRPPTEKPLSLREWSLKAERWAEPG
jgi:hypothetical protein